MFSEIVPILKIIAQDNVEQDMNECSSRYRALDKQWHTYTKQYFLPQNGKIEV